MSRIDNSTRELISDFISFSFHITRWALSCAVANSAHLSTPAIKEWTKSHPSQGRPLSPKDEINRVYTAEIANSDEDPKSPSFIKGWKKSRKRDEGKGHLGPKAFMQEFEVCRSRGYRKIVAEASKFCGQLQFLLVTLRIASFLVIVDSLRISLSRSCFYCDTLSPYTTMSRVSS
ncbi:hypothetical protein CEXT_394021 [Caerostris extrusa]|uniref:Uncharacterized protein n=1 Tax=Caerostris extrusa TaxID=172846 RepID=A0AAV4TZC3_CAEEX|nr:hypothetical protein CEXT_394021 [Caerostris extrusa]